jgi:hypothetical protein
MGVLAFVESSNEELEDSSAVEELDQHGYLVLAHDCLRAIKVFTFLLVINQHSFLVQFLLPMLVH